MKYKKSKKKEKKNPTRQNKETKSCFLKINRPNQTTKERDKSYQYQE